MSASSGEKENLPPHLRKYVVDQFYQRYTPVDQAVWRYILRQLISFLSTHAHPVYRSGLEKTGIQIEQIPRIEEISAKLQEFGWKAVPVSGFIPPAAFMEFQSLGYLPIASDMRSVEHTMYTPAPDIVHEAAGHAPIIADPEYAAYLKKYAEVASHAIISHEDLSLYEAIRDLSDIKERPGATADEIAKAEKHLNETIAGISFVSEAAKLGRMNWWTAEYGLIGDLDKPRIFGAGLLSSPGESQDCLKPHVKKIPLSLDCIEFSYDITEPQPQLFVARDFHHLGDVLDELAQTMAFKRGGMYGLERALEAKTVNTVQLSSGIQISGKLTNVITEDDEAVYLQFTGPCQLALRKRELPGHSRDFHVSGYGTAVGALESGAALETLSDKDLHRHGIAVGKKVRLQYASGVVVDGELQKILRDEKTGTTVLMTFKNCRVAHDGKTLFDPSWGVYDLAVGAAVTSVFGGPADRRSYGETEDFVAKVIPLREFSEEEKSVHRLYSRIRELRQKSPAESEGLADELRALLKRTQGHWLAALEIYEIADKSRLPLKDEALKVLETMSRSDAKIARQIQDGLKLAQELPLIHA